MPTAVYLKCPKGCGLPLRLTHVDSEGRRTYKCSNGHTVKHSAVYGNRSSCTGVNPGKVPENCSQCQKPIREKSITAQNDAKELGRIECGCCGTMFLYDANTHEWVLADE